MKRLVLASLLGITASACGHARLVSRTPTGGIYALEGDRNKAMEDAQAQMAAHCQGPYSILSEGEQVVGTDTAQANETYVAEDGTVVNQGGQSTREVAEWRVQYECTEGEGAPPGYAPQAPPPGYGQQPPPTPGYEPQQSPQNDPNVPPSEQPPGVY